MMKIFVLAVTALLSQAEKVEFVQTVKGVSKQCYMESMPE